MEISDRSYEDGLRIRTTQEALEVFWQWWQCKSQEQMVVMMLDGDHRILGTYLHEFGDDTLKRSNVERLVANCRRVRAEHVIVALFRPCKVVGTADLRFAKRLHKACQNSDIQLLDLIILDSDTYVSVCQ